ncbi:MAG: hypothetical protein HDR26_05700 [Lachnospiraceae bacterium]|nr:hypothetical protein [Lachnospiraceae bacterium]
MKKNTISKALLVLVIIILIFTGLSRILSSNSMTLAEYAAQRQQQNMETESSSPTSPDSDS